MDHLIRGMFIVSIVGFMRKYIKFDSISCWYEPCFTIDTRYINKAKAAYETCIVRTRLLA